MKYNKEMVEPTLLYKDTYKNYNYYIMNYGTHPCCYIQLDKNDKYYGKNYEEIDIDCHGGLTYSEEVKGEWVIGWDYAHYGDYNGFFNGLVNGKKYTTDELIRDCKKVIEQLVNENE